MPVGSETTIIHGVIRRSTKLYGGRDSVQCQEREEGFEYAKRKTDTKSHP